MTTDARRQFDAEILAALPKVQKYALFLMRSTTEADDLVQDTVERALCNWEKFTLGTNMSAWLITILRNRYFSEKRKLKVTRKVELTDEMLRVLKIDADALLKLEIADVLTAMARLPGHMGEALLLVGAGFSMEEMSEFIGVPDGTVKSRINRARAALDQLLAVA